MGLGINKDLEPLVREVRRRGGGVSVLPSNHVRWTLPCGTVMFSGLTMHANVAKSHERKIRAALDPVVKTHRVEPAGGDKWHVVGADGPIRNAGGYPRTYSTPGGAHAAVRRLNQGEDPGPPAG